MKRIQSKKYKLRTYEIDKYFCHVLAIKDMCQVMKFISWLIFIKIVLQAVKRFRKLVIKSILKRLKKIVNKKYFEEIKKDCDTKEKIEKDCDKKDCETTSCQ